MATFYYNSHSGDDSQSQWVRHIQNNAYVEDVTKSVISSAGKQTKDFSVIMSQQTRDINNSIQSASREQAAAIQQSTNAICGTLESGFEMLSYDLQDISSGIIEIKSELNSIASILDWNLSLLIEHQRISNLLLGNISLLLRIPDIQKERQYHVEQGIKFLKNAIFDNDFYEDALTNLLKAEKIEPTDFFSLHRIGLIYMYSLKHIDLKKSEEYFKKAGKYAIAESNNGAIITNNYLAADLSNDLLEQTPTVDAIKLQAAESYLFAARSCYIQGKLNEAADFASKSFNLVPQMLEAGFMHAKVLAANNDEINASIVLEKVINNDRFYSLKTLSDLDLCPKKNIQLLLKRLQKEATENAKNLLDNCKLQMIHGSNAKEYIDEIELLLNKNTYLTSKKAIDLLNKVLNWNFCEPYKNSNQTNYFKEIFNIIKSFNNLEYIGYERYAIRMNDVFFNNFITDINNSTQWIFPFYKVIHNNYRNYDWIDTIKSKEGDYTVVEYLNLEKKFNNDLPDIVFNLKNKLLNYININNQTIDIIKKEQSKRKIEEEIITKNRDNKNLEDSVFESLKGGLLGLFFGFIIGVILVIINLIVTFILTGHGSNNSVIILLISMVVGGSIYAYMYYIETRK